MRQCPKSLFLLAIAVCAGCSTFQPSTLASVRPGEEVRAHLTDIGTDRMEDFLPRVSDGRVVGTLMSVAADSLVLAMWRTDLVTTQSFQPGRIRVAISAPDVLGVDEKRFSRGRTVGFVAALVGGGYLLYDLFGGSTAGGVNRPIDPEILFSRLFRAR